MENINKQIYEEALIFKDNFSLVAHNELLGKNDGKSVGTYIERMFRDILKKKYGIVGSNSSRGIDFPNMKLDIKCTLESRPQSSCPYSDFRQKVYGLGYSLLIFMYDKIDNLKEGTCYIKIKKVFFVEEKYTGDYALTNSINNVLNQTIIEDKKMHKLVELFEKYNLPASEEDMKSLALEIINNPPTIGKLTISNAIQWRLNYGNLNK